MFETCSNFATLRTFKTRYWTAQFFDHPCQGQCPIGDATICEMLCGSQGLLILDDVKLKIDDSLI